MQPAIANAAHRLLITLLGRDARLRIRTQRTLIAGLIYLVSTLFILASVQDGHMPSRAGDFIIAYVMFGFAVFYLAIRLGLTRRLADPALTLPQILHGLAAIVLCYTFVPTARALTLPLMSLSLTFALMSRLSPRQTMYCGLAATLMLVGAFAYLYQERQSSMNVAQEAVNFIMAALTLPVFASVSRQVKEWRERISSQKAELARALEDMRKLATRDELTGLVNRRSMNAALLDEHLRFQRHQRPFCLAILDVDHFKRINDSFGHQQGDMALVALARHLRQHFTLPDQVARWGGEEFVVLLPETTLEAARSLLDDIRQSFQHQVGSTPADAQAMTFSAGVAQCGPDDSPHTLMARADQALYEAKRRGRNLIVARQEFMAA